MTELRYTRHALSRMFERSIGFSEVEAAIRGGIVVEEYPNDVPYCDESLTKRRKRP